MSPEIYREGHVHVRAAKCAQCLYGPDRIVPGARAREITTETRAEEGATFVCHRSQVYGEPEAICRGWWDAFADEDPLLLLAVAMEIVREVA